MRSAWAGLAALGSGCESCDWSFGAIPLEVHVTPESAPATVGICDREYGQDVCQTLHPESGRATTQVRWDGYAVCTYPELVVDATAPGCRPVHQVVRHQHPPKGGIHLEIPLTCP